MGLDYEYQLFFPQEQMWNVLEAIASIARPVGETIIILPNREIVLPFTSRFESKTIVFDEAIKYLYFDTSLYFASDEEIEKYDAEDDLAAEIKALRRDDKGRISIGYIYLRLYILNSNSENNWKSDFCAFHFDAATTDMSLLFENSKSIRQTFIELLEQHNGFVGYFMDSEIPTRKFYVFWPLGMSLLEAKARFMAEPDTNEANS